MSLNSEKTSNDYPIGMFDSGIGGLTVMRAVLELLPHESVLYLGDTAHFPYGDNGAEAIVQYSLANAQFLIEQEIKLLVIACNTASAFAFAHLQNHYAVPIVDVISPSVEKAVEQTRGGSIAVLGTKGTIRSGIYPQKIVDLMPEAEVISLACPLLAPLVEEQWVEHPATRLIVQEYLRPLKKRGIDTLILGCTHYPLLKSVIEEEMEGKVKIIDSASACAWKVREKLSQLELSSSQKSPHYHYYVSGDPSRFQQAGEQFLKKPLEHVWGLQTAQAVVSFI
ncbi:glutamate racemase [Parachlamydia sp. AcF125]|uniref:glutamate racemase n=1 Tax=Parachlamydia sp. AcF125 TaxID=2795736 RepID=UPI001BCA2099|nr:glutamate racemase [Parachlamydia sp. AcF125]MBS4167852.1 Glutamate racemase [Parachlamydia sp. AcF125]